MRIMASSVARRLSGITGYYRRHAQSYQGWFQVHAEVRACAGMASGGTCARTQLLREFSPEKECVSPVFHRGLAAENWALQR